MTTDHTRARPEEGTTLTVVIAGHGYGGEGYCRLEDGGFVSVPHTTMGDVVEVRLGPWRRGRAWAEVVRWIERSPRHAAPTCRHYDRCSGCSMRHLTPTDERHWKLDSVIELLDKFGPPGSANLPIAWIGSDTRDGHRSRGRFSIDRGDDGVRVGLRSVTLDRAIVDIRDCPAQTPTFVEWMTRVAKLIEDVEIEIDTIALETVADGVRFTPEGRDAETLSTLLAETLGRETVEEELRLPHGVVAPRGTWLPTNWTIQGAAVQWAIDQLPELSTATVLDLGAGCGLTTRELARRCARVIAVDEDHRGLAAIDQAGWPNVLTRPGRIGTILKKLRREQVRAEVALIGPMRKPLGRELDELANVGVNAAAYLGPSASSTAKDLRRLATNGYEIRALAAVDLHPGTAQVMLAAAVGETTSS